MTDIYLARHGQSVANAEGWISSWEAVELTARGQQQARELGKRLADEKQELAGILASDLLRAVQTAKLANEALGLEIVTDDGLRERHYGEWIGLDYATLQERLGDLYGAARGDDDPVAPGGESHRTHRTRAVAALQRAVRRWDGRPFLVVSHRGTMRVLLQRAMDTAYERTPVPPDPPETVRMRWPDKRV
jgi:broad specificity phosphatase PhoE